MIRDTKKNNQTIHLYVKSIELAIYCPIKSYINFDRPEHLDRLKDLFFFFPSFEQL